ncbi:MAG TPA: ATPase [Allosphingosinicella sp.]|uniref:F0F1 ATP synthase subunit B family protein n=1 Tax=Allosphingosinicella sp. TaxID=2823234 RepID=UPI002EDA472B
MPQIAQIGATFASQLFWLAITFGLIFVVIGLGMVPKISSTVEARDRRISDDLEAAERARAAADETEEAYRQQLEVNRAEALKVTQAAKDASARETEQKIKAADAELNDKTAAAEAQIRAAADAAKADIENVAAEAAQEMVAKLSGAKVTKAQAAKAVKRALVNG